MSACSTWSYHLRSSSVVPDDEAETFCDHKASSSPRQKHEAVFNVILSTLSDLPQVVIEVGFFLHACKYEGEVWSLMG